MTELKLETQEQETYIPPRRLKDGDLAIIKMFEHYPNKLNQIVQRRGEGLIVVGGISGESWTNCSTWEDSVCLVRKLEKGEKIVIQ